MSKWVRGLVSSIIYVGSVAGMVGGSSLASAGGSAIPSPVRRPVLPTDPIGSSGDIVPLPNYAYPGTQDFNGVSVLTPEQIEAAAAEEQAVWQLMADKAKAEEAASKAEVAALTEKQAAEKLERLAKDWELKASIGVKNLGIAQGVVTEAEKAEADYIRSLTVQSSLKARAKVMEFTIATVSAKLNHSYYKYLSADLNVKTQRARAAADEGWLRSAQANSVKVNARLEADRLREDYNGSSDQRRLDEAAALIESANQKYTATSAKGAEIRGLVGQASVDYYAIKSELDAVNAQAAAINTAVQKRIDAAAEAAKANTAITEAAGAATTALENAKLVQPPQASGTDLAKARKEVAGARANTAKIRIDSIPVFEKDVTKYREAETLVAPLTPALSQALLKSMEDYATSIATWISASKTYEATNNELNKVAKARYSLVKSTAAAEAEARAKLAAAETAVSEAKIELGKAETAVNQLNQNSTSAQIARARSDLAAAQAKKAKADAALALVNLDIATKALAAADAVLATEADVLALQPAQPRINIGLARQAVGTATALETSTRATSESLATLKTTADLRADKIEERSAALNTANDELARLTGLETKANEAYTAAQSAAAQAIAQSADALTVVNERVKIATALEAAANAGMKTIDEAVIRAQARFDLAEANSQTEPAVKALSRVSPADDLQNATTALGLAKNGVDPAHSRYEQTKTLRANAEKAAADIAELTTSLGNYRTRFEGTLAKLETTQQETKAEQAKVQEVVDSGAAPDKVAEAVVGLDKAKAREFAAIADHQDSTVKVARFNLKITEYMAATASDIKSLFPVEALDNGVSDPDGLQAMVDKYWLLAEDTRQAEERVLKSRIAVEEIGEKMADVESAEKKVATLTEDAEAAKAKLEEAQTAEAGILDTVTAKLTEIAARIAPSVFSDSRIDTYFQTQKAREAAAAVNTMEALLAKVDFDNAHVDATKSDLAYSQEALRLATATLTAAKARYTLAYSKRAGLTSSELAESAAAADLAEDSLTAARVQLRKSFTNLIAAYNRSIENKKALLDALAAVPNSSTKKANATKEALAKLNDALVAAQSDEANAIAEERNQRLKQADALAEHGEALANGKVQRKIALEKIVRQKMKELAGHKCKKTDTDPLTCMVCNAQFEAGIDETWRGKLLPNRVATVRLYTKDHPWGDTMCEVIYDDNQFSWTNFPSPRKNNGYKLKGDEAELAEFMAAFVAYYEVNLPFSYEMYYSPASMVPACSHPREWSRREESETFGESVAYRIRSQIDLTEVHEDANLRLYRSDIDPATLGEPDIEELLDQPIVPSCN